MAGPEALSCVCIVVLVEQQAITPVRIFLELAVWAEASTVFMFVLAKQTDHAIGDFCRHGKWRDGLAVAALSSYREVRSKRATEF